jgi:hypothetical protein
MKARSARFLSIFAAVLALTALPQAAAAMKFYVANAIGEVKPEEKVTPQTRQPVQVLFEFQRDGTPNAKATKLVTPWAIEDIKATGAFSHVTDAPSANGAILSIKFNNIVVKEELNKTKKQAFGAGLGFGLFGGVLAVDHDRVSIDEMSATGAAPIHTEVKHELYANYGKKDVDVPGAEYKNADAAVRLLVRQALSRGVNDIGAEPAFPR